jgi:hypothetical protein
LSYENEGANQNARGASGAEVKHGQWEVEISNTTCLFEDRSGKWESRAAPGMESSHSYMAHDTACDDNTTFDRLQFIVLIEHRNKYKIYKSAADTSEAM